MHLLKTEKGRKCSFFTKQKTRTGQNVFSSPGGRGGGVLGISSDGDDRRSFLSLKFSIPGFFWERKFGKYFLG